MNYREPGADRAIREAAPNGVDLIVEVNPVGNGALDRDVIADNGTIASYASDPDALSIDVGEAMQVNTRYQFVLVYTMPAEAKDRAIADITAALEAGVLRIGRRQACRSTGSRWSAPPRRTRPSRPTRWARS